MDVNQVPEVDTCCCGLLSLKTGTYIIAVLTLFFDILAHGYYLVWYPFGTLIHNIYIIMIILAIIASLTLMIGVFYNKRWMVFFFIVIYTLLFIGTIAMIIWMTLSALRTNNPNVAAERTADSIDAAIYCLLIGYCLMVVSSYYKIM